MSDVYLTGSTALVAQLQSERAKVKALREALRTMLEDYRSEGCPIPGCLTCQRSNAAYSKAIAALAAASDPIEAPSDVHPQGE